ncbi:MAG: energy transducer TonB [Planctomycetes bacterium]|nr:energy transducer TonB [Planctomycetota bacterium]
MSSNISSTLLLKHTDKSRLKRAPNTWLISILLHAVLFSVLMVAAPLAVSRSLEQSYDSVESVALQSPPETFIRQAESIPEIAISEDPVFKMPLDIQDPEPETPALEDIPVQPLLPKEVEVLDTEVAVSQRWETKKRLLVPAVASTSTSALSQASNPQTGGGGGGGNGTGLIGAGSNSGYGAGHGTGFGVGTGSGLGLGNGSGSGQGAGSGQGNGKGSNTSAGPGLTRPTQLKGSLNPAYPEGERKGGRTATVLLEVFVDAKGRVQEIRVISGEDGNAFVSSAIAAARGARYGPALEDGNPVPGCLKLRINYRLE